MIKKIFLVYIFSLISSYSYAACIANVTFGNEATSIAGPTITDLRQPYQLHEAVSLRYISSNFATSPISVGGQPNGNIDFLARDFASSVASRDYSTNIFYIDDASVENQTFTHSYGSVSGNEVYLSGLDVNITDLATTSTIWATSSLFTKVYLTTDWGTLLTPYTNSATSPEFYQTHSDRAIQFLQEINPISVRGLINGGAGLAQEYPPSDAPQFYGSDAGNPSLEPINYIHDSQQRRGGFFVRYRDSETYDENLFSPWIRIDKKEILGQYLSLSADGNSDQRVIWLDQRSPTSVYSGANENDLLSMSPDIRIVADGGSTFSQSAFLQHENLNIEIDSSANKLQGKVGSLVFDDTGTSDTISFSDGTVVDNDAIYVGQTSGATKIIQLGNFDTQGNSYISADRLALEANGNDNVNFINNTLTDIGHINISNGNLIIRGSVRDSGLYFNDPVRINANNRVVDFRGDNVRGVDTIEINNLMANYITSSSTIVFNILGQNSYDAQQRSWGDISTLTVGDVQIYDDNIKTSDNATLFISANPVSFTNNATVTDITTLTVGNRTLMIHDDTIRSIRGSDLNFYSSNGGGIEFASDTVNIRARSAVVEITGNEQLTLSASGQISALSNLRFDVPEDSQKIVFRDIEVAPKQGTENTSSHATDIGDIRITSDTQITTQSGDLILKSANNTIDMSGLYLGYINDATDDTDAVPYKQMIDRFNAQSISDFSDPDGNLNMNNVGARNLSGHRNTDGIVEVTAQNENTGLRLDDVLSRLTGTNIQGNSNSFLFRTLFTVNDFTQACSDATSSAIKRGNNAAERIMITLGKGVHHTKIVSMVVRALSFHSQHSRPHGGNTTPNAEFNQAHNNYHWLDTYLTEDAGVQNCDQYRANNNNGPHFQLNRLTRHVTLSNDPQHWLFNQHRSNNIPLYNSHANIYEYDTTNNRVFAYIFVGTHLSRDIGVASPQDASSGLVNSTANSFPATTIYYELSSICLTRCN